MSPTLRNMLVGVGVFALAGVGIYVSTPQPASRSMADLRGAGIAAGQKFVMVCPERLTPATRRRILANQPGSLRPKQRYARVARVAVCFNPDGGNCFAPATGAARVGDLLGEVVIPSLRANVVDADLDAGVDDAGESSEVDDSLVRHEGCEAITCPNADAGGVFATGACGARNRLWMVPSACMIPNCWSGPGGAWDDSAVVDCRRLTVPMGGAVAVPRWAGCNVMPTEQAVGAACVPSECDVIAGDNPFEDL